MKATLTKNETIHTELDMSLKETSMLLSLVQAGAFSYGPGSQSYRFAEEFLKAFGTEINKSWEATARHMAVCRERPVWKDSKREPQHFYFSTPQKERLVVIEWHSEDWSKITAVIEDQDGNQPQFQDYLYFRYGFMPGNTVGWPAKIYDGEAVTPRPDSSLRYYVLESELIDQLTSRVKAKFDYETIYGRAK